MAFKVKLIPSAENDLREAMAYYHSIRPNLGKMFFETFLQLNNTLQTNPFYAKKYKSVRTIALKKFPYLVHFIVDEEPQTVTIIAIIFGKGKKTTFAERLNLPDE
ncbi:MAG: type II toxin-antitoxin system RelE/ParE family toxin [Bacteroidia bacterium]|nr:type II toxin-antitoxin system RelE/ParE family toxin [Bacteroidia bacterium]